MPSTTPQQKITKVRRFGQEHVEVVLIGDTFDDDYSAASAYAELEGKLFIHPFNDLRTIEGQGTVGLEIHEDLLEFGLHVDFIFMALGGGGLASILTGKWLRKSGQAEKG